MNWFNLYGVIIVVLLLLPNMMYAHKIKYTEEKCHNMLMNLLEQVGRYGAMLMMVLNIGLSEPGFQSQEAFAVWLVSNSLLILLYLICWQFYIDSQVFVVAMMLAVLPSILFVANGFMFRHWLLIIFGCIFSVSHIYVTYHNNRAKLVS